MREKSDPLFGTPNIDKLTPNELLEESLALAPGLFCINSCIRDRSIKMIDQDRKEVIRFIEINKFGKDKYPWLWTFEFDDDKLLSVVKIWPDPHYDTSEQPSTAFVGIISSFSSLSVLNKDLRSLLDTFNSLLTEDFNVNSLPNTICVAGNDHGNFLVGRARKPFFENKFIHPYATITSASYT